MQPVTTIGCSAAVSSPPPISTLPAMPAPVSTSTEGAAHSPAGSPGAFPGAPLGTPLARPGHHVGRGRHGGPDGRSRSAPGRAAATDRCRCAGSRRRRARSGPRRLAVPVTVPFVEMTMVSASRSVQRRMPALTPGGRRRCRRSPASAGSPGRRRGAWGSRGGPACLAGGVLRCAARAGRGRGLALAARARAELRSGRPVGCPRDFACLKGATTRAGRVRPCRAGRGDGRRRGSP